MNMLVIVNLVAFIGLIIFLAAWVVRTHPCPGEFWRDSVSALPLALCCNSRTAAIRT